MSKKRTIILLIIFAVFLFLVGISLGIYTAVSEKANSFNLGIVAGIVTVAMVCVIILAVRIGKNIDFNKFDERQLKVRGECYQISFVSLVALLITDSLIRTLTNYEWSSYLVGVLICILISCGIFIILTILKEAYEFNITLKSSIITLSFGLLYLFIILMSSFRDNEGFITDGKVNDNFLMLICGGIFLLAGIASLIKYFLNKKMEDDDIEES